MAWMVLPKPISSARIAELCLPEGGGKKMTGIHTSQVPCGHTPTPPAPPRLLAPGIRHPVEPAQLVVPQLQASLAAQPWWLLFHDTKPRAVLEYLCTAGWDTVGAVPPEEGVNLLLEVTCDQLPILPGALRVGKTHPFAKVPLLDHIPLTDHITRSYTNCIICIIKHLYLQPVRGRRRGLPMPRPLADACPAPWLTNAPPPG